MLNLGGIQLIKYLLLLYTTLYIVGYQNALKSENLC